MNALLDTHILLWWHGDRGRLSQRSARRYCGRRRRLAVAGIRYFALGSGNAALSRAYSPDDSPAGVAGEGGRTSTGAATWHFSGGSGRVGFVAGFLSSRPGRPHSRGNRPCARRDTSDPGPQNHRSRTGQHAELILRSWLFFS